MNYTPDAWHLIKIKSDEHGTQYRVLAGWYGGYAGADSWKMNSGITRYEEDEHGYHFYGVSGSCYYCNKHVERLTGLTGSIFSSYALQNSENYSIELITLKQFKKEFKIKRLLKNENNS